MIRLSKKVEYSLIALSYIASKKNGKLVSAKEIAFCFQIPKELMAKILQKLTQEGYICSIQGPKGGYQLSRSLEEINLTDLIKSIEGSLSLIDCEKNSEINCVRINDCVIRAPMLQINQQINRYFDKITLDDILNSTIPKITTS